MDKAEEAKLEGNALLKKGDLQAAIAKYAEGAELTESLLEKDAFEVGEELKQRSTAVYVALRLNSAQACLNHGDPARAAEHADKVLSIDKDNSKALYRRAMASLQFDSESRLEQARADLVRFTQLEPASREVREHLTKAKERLKAAKQLEKERYASALNGGGLYKEQHAKTDRQRLLYEEEVARRKEAGEDEVTFDNWLKKQKEKAEESAKNEKEAREKKEVEERVQREQTQFDEDNVRRKAEGLEELTLAEWREDNFKKLNAKDQVMNTDDVELDDEEKKLLSEAKKKGYYHGRLGTVLSDAAPKPQQMEADEAISPITDSTPNGHGHSEWNTAGTWEERDATAWAKEELTTCLKSSSVGDSAATLTSGQAVSVSAKISSVRSVRGDAQMVVVRKRRRHGFNFEAELSFHVVVTPPEEGSAETFKGTFSLPEIVDSVELSTLRIDVKWRADAPPERLQPLANAWVGKLMDDVREQIGRFVQEYKKR